jgi:hypothetical protein
METIVVKFLNNFHVPGFGRRRFPAGIVEDVPASMRNKLPRTAEIFEDYVSGEAAEAEVESLAAADFARMATDTSGDALEKAGMSGFAEEGDPGFEVDDDGKLVEAVEGVKKPSRKAKK